jgi:hypothetical protein
MTNSDYGRIDLPRKVMRGSVQPTVAQEMSRSVRIKN